MKTNTKTKDLIIIDFRLSITNNEYFRLEPVLRLPSA